MSAQTQGPAIERVRPDDSAWPAAWAGDVLESLEGGIVVASADLSVVYQNAVAAEWLGKAGTLEELFGGARFIGPFRTWEEEIAEVLSRKETIRFQCVPDTSEAATTRVLSLFCSPLQNSGGDGIDGVVISLRDSTQRFGLEERLAVSERLASIGKLAARVAHELNNPLDGILRYVNLAMRISKGGDAEKITSYLGESRTGLMRMVKIISELLEFSRSSREQFDLTGINDLVEQAIDELTPRAEANRVVMSVDFQDANLPGVRGTRLFQVLINLVKNAIEAMPDGGRIAITTGIVESDVVIRVADTGPGLPEDVDKVFEPFYTTKQAGKGTGLGLAICKDFLEGMNGTISAANAQDGGAVFTVRIPTSECQRVETPPPLLSEAEGSVSGDPADG